MDVSFYLYLTGSGSWADSIDDDIPRGPAPKTEQTGPRRGDADYFDSLPDREARGPGGFSDRGPPREELPLPTRAPYTAFVGNLTFETTEGDLSAFFESSQTVSVKIIKDHEGKHKGFGYVEFKDVEGLKDALSRSGQHLGGRDIRVNVAEPPKERGFGGSGGAGGFGPSMADESNQWRRSGPLPARESEPVRGMSSNRYDNPLSSSSGGGDPLGERDWGAARGSKFTASAAAPALSGRDRDFGGPRAFGGPDAPMPPKDISEMPNDWRSTRPARPVESNTPSPSLGHREPREAGPPRSSSGFIERENVLTGAAATEETWSRGAKFSPAPTPAPAADRPDAPARASSKDTAPIRPELEEKSDWRSSRKPSIAAESSPSNSVTPSPQPTRRALNLAPRSASASATPESATSPTTSSATTAAAASTKPSPFGAARAVDTAAKDSEAAEKLRLMDEQIKADREAKAKQVEAEKEKAKKEAEEKAKEAAVAAMAKADGDAPAAAKTTQTNGRSSAPGGPRTFERGTGGAPSARGAAGAGAGRGGPPRVHPSRLAAQATSAAAPREPKKEKEVPTVDDDGFSTVTGTRKARENAAAAAQAEKEAIAKKNEARPQFSFSAAARASGLGGFVEDAANDNENEEGAAGKGDVEEIAKGVQDVSV